MLRIVVAPAAEEEIRSILAWSNDNFGAAACQRYDALLRRAIKDLAANPDRAGVCKRPELGVAVRTYHLQNSRAHVPTNVGRVQAPRHFLIFRVTDDGVLHVARVLHDSMDLNQHLPDDDDEELS